MTWILSFDISTQQTVITLGKIHSELDSRCELIVWDEEHAQTNQTADRLIPKIETLIKTAGLSLKDIDIIACGKGPGTFTGSRVAIATAKGLALGLSRPIYGVSTLVSLAATAQHSGPVIAILNAQKSEVYSSCFQCHITAQHPETARISPQTSEECTTLEKALTLPLQIFPNSRNVSLIAAGFTNFALPKQNFLQIQVVAGVSPLGLWSATLHTLHHERAADLATLNATYLRPSYAELNKVTLTDRQ